MVVVKGPRQCRARLKISLFSLTQVSAVSLESVEGHVDFQVCGPGPSTFQVSSLAGAVHLTDSVARKHLIDIFKLLGFQKHFTFHDLRHYGVTLVFRDGVPL